jgi:hypothetical protein
MRTMSEITYNQQVQAFKPIFDVLLNPRSSAAKRDAAFERLLRPLFDAAVAAASPNNLFATETAAAVCGQLFERAKERGSQ